MARGASRVRSTGERGLGALSGTARTTQRLGSVVRRLPPAPGSVGEARDLVRDLLDNAGRDDLAETATLIVSEVVTNAILHAGTPIDVSVTLDDSGLRVEVGDGSTHLPTRRRYATTAGTGRGLMLLERMVDDWGATRHGSGKTVWFHLDGPGPAEEPVARHEDDVPVEPAMGDTVGVHLLKLPLLLHTAWQEHAEALLREYLLHTLDDDTEVDPIQVHAEATDAIAILEEQVPRVGVAHDPRELMADVTEPSVSMEHLLLEVPLASVRSFETLDRVIETAIDLSLAGRIMTPPTQPEMQSFRRWLCRQVVDQAAGRPPRPWSVETEPPFHPGPRLPWDPTAVTGSAAGVIAADDANRIVAVSAPALELLGYDEPGQIVGRRLLAIIPDRFRQAHVAGLTMFLLVGRRPMIGRSVEVPALRRDGSEVLVELVITAEQVGRGRTVFLADIRRV
jgi:PAS domain S-box-containing protein